MMLVPEAWQNDPLMSPERRDFYRCALTTQPRRPCPPARAAAGWAARALP